MSESMGKETKQNSSKSDKKNINHIDNSIERQTDGPGSILEIKDLCFAYPEEEKRALNHISFQIKEGEFLVLCGKSGCGKSTLLKHMKTPLTPHGKRKGEILFDGKNLHEMTGREQSQRIGYVLQNPDNQIVTDKVWHELAFGLESLGYKSAEIRIRVAEMASYFGIQDWFYKNVAELSGGQKQLLNLASIMAMHPDILILDEPTSQLDPIAASDFLGTVKKINRDLGTTILLTEHRLEEVFPAADRVVVMEGGEVLCMGTPEEIDEDNNGVSDYKTYVYGYHQVVKAAAEGKEAVGVPGEDDYQAAVEAAEATQVPPIFDYIRLANLVEGQLEKEKLRVPVRAYAIQADFLQSADNSEGNHNIETEGMMDEATLSQIFAVFKNQNQTEDPKTGALAPWKGIHAEEGKQAGMGNELDLIGNPKQQ